MKVDYSIGAKLYLIIEYFGISKQIYLDITFVTYVRVFKRLFLQFLFKICMFLLFC